MRHRGAASEAATSLRLRGRWRVGVRAVHRWTGLVIWLLVCAVSLSGTLLAFRADIDRWLNRDIMTTVPGRTRVSLAEAIVAVERTEPDTFVRALFVPQRPDATITVVVRPFVQVFVDPYSGRVLGGRDGSRRPLNRRSVMPLLQQFHYNLRWSLIGQWLLGGVALVWLVSLAGGAWLAWPTDWWRGRGWRPLFAIRSRGGLPGKVRDWHISLGLVLLPVTLMFAGTAVAMNLSRFVHPLVGRLTPLTPEPSAGRQGWPAGAISIDDAVNAAQPHASGGRVYWVSRDAARGRYVCRFVRADDRSPYGDHWVYVDAATGVVTDRRVPSTATRGDRLLDWLFPLHSGLAFGRFGQVAVAVSGIAITFVALTGAYVWWASPSGRRRLGRHERSARLARPDWPTSSD